jgi:renal tumor antigen
LKVRSRRTGEFYAVKRLKARFRTLDDACKLTEISTLRALQGHANIVRLMDILYDSQQGHLAFVLELQPGNLIGLLRGRNAPLDEKASLLVLYQLLKAISFMHSHFILHRDINPENCMVDPTTLGLKLIDFGSARPAGTRGPFTEYVSTRWYRAPECLLTR